MKEDDEPTENYRGAFGGTLGFGNAPALILVDFVAAYFDKNSSFYAGVEDALASALRIRSVARKASPRFCGPKAKPGLSNWLLARASLDWRLRVSCILSACRKWLMQRR